MGACRGEYLADESASAPLPITTYEGPAGVNAGAAGQGTGFFASLALACTGSLRRFRGAEEPRTTTMAATQHWEGLGGWMVYKDR